MGGVLPREELEATTTDEDQSGPTPSFHWVAGGGGGVGVRRK